jgi:hypothetical protein
MTLALIILVLGIAISALEFGYTAKKFGKQRLRK